MIRGSLYLILAGQITWSTSSTRSGKHEEEWCSRFGCTCLGLSKLEFRRTRQELQKRQFDADTDKIAGHIWNEIRTHTHSHSHTPQTKLERITRFKLQRKKGEGQANREFIFNKQVLGLSLWSSGGILSLKITALNASWLEAVGSYRWFVNGVFLIC
jgi:hypothetical protein